LKAPICTIEEATESAQLQFGYSIFLGLMNDESQVAGILKFKSTSNTTSALLRAISEVSREAGQAVKGLEGELGLPIIEIDTRNRITNIQMARLLLAGQSFELKMLLSQANAMGYARSLAASLAEADPDSARSKMMTEFENSFADLEDAAIVQLLVLTRG
jgi:hypothetical protein